MNRHKHLNDHKIHLLNPLLEQAREAGFIESDPHRYYSTKIYKGFLVTTDQDEESGKWRTKAYVQIPSGEILFDSQIQASERDAVGAVHKQIDLFRKYKPNDNRIIV